MVTTLCSSAFFVRRMGGYFQQLIRQSSNERVVKTGFGCHLIRAEEIKKPVQRTCRDAKKEIKARLEKDTMKELEDRPRGKYGVKVDYRVLDSRPEKKWGSKR